MVRGRVTKSLVEDSRTNQNSNITRMKSRLTRQRKLPKNNQQCITEFFEVKVSPFKIVKPQPEECDLTISPPSRKFYEQDYFESKYKDMILVALEKSPKIQRNEQVLLTGSPLHRIQLNTDEITLPGINNKPHVKPNCRQLTEFFPIRRSERKTKKLVQAEKQKSLEEQLRSGIEDGLEVHNFKDKGRGVVATKLFNRGDFVVEYSGELLDMVQAKQREEKYAQDTTTGCYMYYFKFQNRQFCIDATAETGRLGRLINHSRNGNLITRTIDVDTLPRLVLIAKDFINVGEELCYDYGDRSKESLKHHPWLAL